MIASRRAFLIGSAALALALPGAALAAGYTAQGPHAVKTADGIWHDQGRNREVPWLIRYPADLSAPAPVVIFSHGLGGSRTGAAYYGDFLASHGYVVVYVEHPGSNTEALRASYTPGQGIDYAKLGRIAADPQVVLGRFRDIPYALDQLTAMNAAPGLFQGRLDMSRVGMSGHSFGAVTTQAMAGQRYPAGALGEPRFKAFLAMSPSGARDGDNARAFGGFTRPMFFMTGTEDSVKVGGTNPDPLDRQKPFAATPDTTPAIQMVFNGGDHMVFSGRSPLGGNRPHDDQFRAEISAAALAFWDAYLRDDADARTWLRGGGLAAYVGKDAVVSVKGP